MRRFSFVFFSFGRAPRGEFFRPCCLCSGSKECSDLRAPSLLGNAGEGTFWIASPPLCNLAFTHKCCWVLVSFVVNQSSEGRGEGDEGTETISFCL